MGPLVSTAQTAFRLPVGTYPAADPPIVLATVLGFGVFLALALFMFAESRKR